MKKFYTLLTFAILSTATFAQRTIDLKLNLTTPVAGSTVAKSDAQNITFTVENLESDYAAGDSLFVYYVNVTTQTAYTLSGVANQISFFPLTAELATGLNSQASIPSVAFNNGNQLTLNTNVTGFNVGDVVAVVVELIGGPDNVGEEAEATFANNMASFTLGAASVGIESTLSTNLVAFPVPAENILNFKSNEALTSINVLSLDGKVVATANGSSVDVSTLTSGIYVYEVTSVSGATATNKFVKK